MAPMVMGPSPGMQGASGGPGGAPNSAPSPNTSSGAHGDPLLNFGAPPRAPVASPLPTRTGWIRVRQRLSSQAAEEGVAVVKEARRDKWRKRFGLLSGAKDSKPACLFLFRGVPRGKNPAFAECLELSAGSEVVPMIDLDRERINRGTLRDRAEFAERCLSVREGTRRVAGTELPGREFLLVAESYVLFLLLFVPPQRCGKGAKGKREKVLFRGSRMLTSFFLSTPPPSPLIFFPCSLPFFIFSSADRST
jgi:hypothetical protein